MREAAGLAPIDLSARYSADEVSTHLARTEIFLTGMNRDSTVYMVGSGGMPLSVLFMHRFTDARIICLEISEESLQDGRNFCNFLIGQHPDNFRREAIDLRYGDGATFDYGECDIIVLSIHTMNKVEMIQRIIDTAPRDRDVIVVERQVKDLWGSTFIRTTALIRRACRSRRWDR